MVAFNLKKISLGLLRVQWIELSWQINRINTFLAAQK